MTKHRAAFVPNPDVCIDNCTGEVGTPNAYVYATPLGKPRPSDCSGPDYGALPDALCPLPLVFVSVEPLVPAGDPLENPPTPSPWYTDATDAEALDGGRRWRLVEAREIFCLDEDEDARWGDDILAVPDVLEWRGVVPNATATRLCSDGDEGPEWVVDVHDEDAYIGW